jgi:2',3'-cyclic-nucleotide 2'-phosphodiesterase / 3'-nucleotidase
VSYTSFQTVQRVVLPGFAETAGMFPRGIPESVAAGRGSTSSAPGVAGSGPGEIALRLIATTDLHACLLSYDYCANRPVSGRGLAQIARQIALARAEVPNSLLLDNGDFLQGTPLADYVATAPRRRRPHPVIAAFNALGYDAATLGNHEFNYGLPVLSSAIAAAKFPIVSANVAVRLGKSPARDETFVPPFAVLPRTVVDSEGRPHRLRIGVIGFTPPQIEVWDRDHLAGRIRTRDILAAARAWLPRLKARGADIIVALAHSGIGAPDAENGAENAATALAALPEIDAVIAGHSHMIFPGPGFSANLSVDPVAGTLSGKPAVMPGHSGSHIGIIDLVLARDSRAGWSVRKSRARVTAASAGPSLAERLLRHEIDADHRATLAWSRRIIGETRVPLHTHFATIAPNASIDLIAAAKTDHVKRRLVGTKWEGMPVFSSIAPFRAGGRGGPQNFTDIKTGPIRMRSVSDLYHFPNTLVTLAMTGAQIADWLEQSAALFRQITPGARDAALLNEDVPSFTFEIIPGLTYEIDLAQPARFDAYGLLINHSARRIRNLRHNGAPLDPKARVLLVTNNHRASRAKLQSASGAAMVALAEGARAQDVICDHIRRERFVGAEPLRTWSFVPMPQTTVTLATGEGAAAHLGDIASFRPEILRDTEDGFRHYRLHL